MEDAADIKEVKEWKTGPEVDGLNDMVRGVNDCIKWINGQKKKGDLVTFVARDEESTIWQRFTVRGEKGDEVEEPNITCECVCECTYVEGTGADIGDI